MKFFIVLLAVVAAASAGHIGILGGYGGHAISQPWVAPAAVVQAPVAHSPVVHAPQPWVAPAHLPWVAPAPKYVKVAAPVAYAKETYHVEAPGAGSAAQPHIPGPHAKPVSYKGNDHVTRIHWSGGHAAHPHLVGVEHYVAAPEPAISVVKTGHGW